MHRLCYAAVLSALALGLTAGTSCASTSYHVGNSLTVDSKPDGVAEFAAARGITHDVGYHIRSSTSLNAIIAFPDSTTTTPPEPYGVFGNALPNYTWDAVTLQPHNRSVSVGGFASTLATDVTSVLSMIDLTRSNSANADTKFFIYSPWARQNNYQAGWEFPVEDLDESLTRHARDYYDHLMGRLRQATNVDIHMIPVGEVIYELDKALSNDEVPGFTSISQFYRDQIHLNSNRGRYVAGLTTYATLFNDTPYGLAPTESYGGANILTLEQQEALQGIVSEVVSRHQYSGVSFPTPTSADFDQSGQVEATDLQMWGDSYGIVDPYDPNDDGVVDQADRLIWEQNATVFHPADFNRDGRVNPLDFDVWEASEGVDAGGDADDDGDTDEDDRSIWAAANVPFAPSDMNQDGLVNSGEYELWRDSYGNSAGGDFNGNGIADGADFLLWQRDRTPYNPADSNQDFVVDELDLLDWERSVGYNQAVDINGDKVATGIEFLTWQQEFGMEWPPGGPGSNNATASASTVPEPSSLLLLLSGLALATRSRRRSN